MTGRPSDFTPELAEEICLRIVDGRSLRKICDTVGMPDMRTVMRWLAKGAEKIEPYTSFCQQYTRARELQAEYFFDEIVDIADDKTDDVIKTPNGPVLNKEFVERSKVRIDARKWMLSKMLPKKYGDSLKLQGDKDNPLTTTFTLVMGDKKIDEA